MIKNFKSFILISLIITGVTSVASAQLNGFSIRQFSPNEFDKFQKVFGEMRGPIRSLILKDKKTDFETADPLMYVEKVKDEKDVKKVLKEVSLTWPQFEELMSNVIIAYFSIQPDRTKVSLIKQLAGYGLVMSVDGIPEGLRSVLTQVLKTDEGATLAGMALDTVIQIPPQNIKIVKDNKLTLDSDFYTRQWRGKLETRN